MRAAAAIAAAALLATAAPALADDASEARLQYELGSELYKQKRFTEALERFIASNRLVPNSNVVYNIASIYMLLGKREAGKDRQRSAEWYVEAFNWTETLARMAASEADRKDAAKLRTTLLSKVAVLSVQSEPSGAEVYVDRESLGSVGRTPRDVATTPGDHTLIVKLAGHRPAQHKASARLGASSAVRVPLERIVGTLQVNARPAGVRLQYFPGGLDLGLSPATAKVPVGDGRVTLTLAGYLTQTRDVTVREGELTTLDIELQKAADRAASLTVVGRPEGATVRLGGREVGRVPLTLAGLDPGRHSLELAADAHNPWRGDLLLEAGSSTRVEAVLLRPEERPWRGWKWIGYGAGTALVGAGGVFALQARSARHDFFASPSSAGRDRVDRLNTRADVVLGAGLVTLATTAVLQWALGDLGDSRAKVRTAR
jgi:hypothetical protein